jgi:hypothetical protein
MWSNARPFEAFNALRGIIYLFVALNTYATVYGCATNTRIVEVFC